MMNIDPNVEPIVPVPQSERMAEKRSEAVRESNAQEDPTRVQLSDVAKDFSKAVQQLKAEEQVRPDMVNRGKDILDNWKKPSDDEVDTIINGIFDEA